MPYRYPNARQLDKQPKIGDAECVTLIRHYTNAPHTSMWRQGVKVLGNKDILPGTAIANFENGRWPGRSRGESFGFLFRPGFRWYLRRRPVAECREKENFHPFYQEATAQF